MRVTLPDLPKAIRRRTASPFLVSIGEHAPKVVSVHVDVRGAFLAMSVGGGTMANVAARPAVTLVWPADSVHPDHTLLVDGQATEEDGLLVVVPSSAIMHVRPEEAGAAESG